MRFTALILAMSVLLTAPRAQAADLCGEIPDAMVLLDRSGSMTYNTIGGRTLWDIAKEAISTTTAKFERQMGFGLMLFPRWDNITGSPCAPDTTCCKTAGLNVGVSTTSNSAINTVMGSAYPHPGTSVPSTPATSSLLEAGDELAKIKVAGKSQYVIFITDGKQVCTPIQPSEATQSLYNSGIKTFVVGFGSQVDAYQLEQAAIQGGTGSYYQADDLAGLNTALQAIAGNISCCGNNTIDAGEICDPCPTSCNDGDPNTLDQLMGAACNAYCKYTPITPDPCGNGVVDSNERCDTAIAPGQPGACPRTPADCDDTNACTSDQVYGSACQAVCTHMNICPTDQCGDGVVQATEKCDTAISGGTPGYCPQGPADCDDGNSATTDYVVGTSCQAECDHSNSTTPPVCGNGKVEAGEWCDTAIPANQAGSCPTSCNDGVQCTADTLLGSGCLTYCANTPITKAIHGDGCCPPGATSATDNDCGTACGNGSLEPGETCDPGIAAGLPGSCPAGCPDDGDKCTTQVLGGSACQPQCITQSVPANLTAQDGCCPPGLSNKQDADCLPPCTPDNTENCVNPCEDINCPDGQFCNVSTAICEPYPNGNGANGYADGMAGGCDCRVSDEGSAWPLFGLLALLVFWRRRRS